MEFEIKPYIVYVKIDDQNYITAINSSAFILDPSDWFEIDNGFGDKYHHAQANYFDKPIVDEQGIYRYLYTPEDETLWRECKQESTANTYNNL